MIDLWKHNRTDLHWQLSVEEIVKRFMASKWAKPYLEKTPNWPLERSIRAFLTSEDDGLASVFEEHQYPRIHDAIAKAIWPD